MGSKGASRGGSLFRWWAAFSSIVQQLVARIPWGHQVRILDRVKDGRERERYLRASIERNWSRNVLMHQIENGPVRSRGKALRNFQNTLSGYVVLSLQIF
jgi:hypothetical protein